MISLLITEVKGDSLMKKTVAAVLLLSLIGFCAPVLADDGVRDNRVQAGPYNAPQWNDYVPAKYQNPRTDYSKGGAITEIVAGTLLIPFTLPLIFHGSDKLKNISYAQKKEQYFRGLDQAQNMTYEQQQAYYPQLLQQCGLKK